MIIMNILDLIIGAYLLFVRIVAEKNISEKEILRKAIYMSSSFWSFYVFFLLAFINDLMNLKISISPIIGGTLIILLIFFIFRIQSNIYNARYTRVLDKINKIPHPIFFVIVFLHWIISIFLLVLSYRYIQPFI